MSTNVKIRNIYVMIWCYFFKSYEHRLDNYAMTLDGKTDMKNRRESGVSLVSMDRKYSVISNASL